MSQASVSQLPDSETTSLFSVDFSNQNLINIDISDILGDAEMSNDQPQNPFDRDSSASMKTAKASEPGIVSTITPTVSRQNSANMIVKEISIENDSSKAIKNLTSIFENVEQKLPSTPSRKTGGKMRQKSGRHVRKSPMSTRANPLASRVQPVRDCTLPDEAPKSLVKFLSENRKLAPCSLSQACPDDVC